ncbi:MAG: peptidoglycan DD-metalloendopeptidase family protein [Acidimicrobiia bacterium]|nr:peptidoglycan DD-metalloendopeptidase family protein [Acidimicrobiia bacterium]
MSRLLLASSMLILLASPTVAPVCVGFVPPVEGAIVEAFAPEGTYAGHWGIDFDVPPGTMAGAAAPGVVAFAGEVVGVRSVTVDHGGGVRSTVSWLGEVAVGSGETVEIGQPLGRFGGGHEGGLHFSVRVDGAYVDPGPLLGCIGGGYSDALALVP